MDRLPKGWRWVRLGEVCRKFVNGGTPDTNNPIYWDGPIPWITGADVTSFRVSGGRRYITEEGLEKSATHLVRKNTVLVVTRTGVGRVCVTAKDICFSQDITGIICGDEVHPEYLARFILSQANRLRHVQRGATIQGLTRRELRTMVIPLPPLSEQRRIAAKIHELLQEVDRARTACERQLEAANALPGAHLQEVFESEEAKKWEKKTLGEVCEFLDSMRIPVNETERQKRVAGKELSDLYPYYGANGQVGWIDTYLFDEELVLLAEDGGFFGSSERPIAYRVSGKCWVNNHAHVLRAKKDVIDADWLHFTLAVRPDVIQFVSGTTRLKLNQEKASLIPISLPSHSVQQCMAAELKEKMSQADKLRTGLERQLQAINALPEAILRKAFTGRL